MLQFLRVALISVALIFSTIVARAADDFIFDIADNVPSKQVELIKRGLEIAQDYLDANFGGGVPAAVRATITVKVVATGKGNQEDGGGGGAATGLDASGMRPFFDVAHPQWAQNTQGRGWTRESEQLATVVHEYTHGWASTLGGLTMFSQPLGNWMNEGIAAYVGFSAIVDLGKMSRRNVDKFMINSIVQKDGEGAYPLTAYSTSQSPLWAGHIGYLAIEWLVDSAPSGPRSLRILNEEIGKGRSSNKAFATAFGLEASSFYEQFAVWQAMILKNPANAMSKRPKLVLSGG